MIAKPSSRPDRGCPILRAVCERWEADGEHPSLTNGVGFLFAARALASLPLARYARRVGHPRYPHRGRPAALIVIVTFVLFRCCPRNRNYEGRGAPRGTKLPVTYCH